VIPRVFRIESRRPRADGRVSNQLAVPELISRQINFYAARKPVPHVRFNSLAFPEDVRRQDFSAKDVVHDEGRDVALPPRRIVRRPSIVLVRRVKTPACSNGLLDVGERVHRARVYRRGSFAVREDDAELFALGTARPRAVLRVARLAVAARRFAVRLARYDPALEEADLQALRRREPDD
jgi:hypothetical protein